MIAKCTSLAAAALLLWALGSTAWFAAQSTELTRHYQAQSSLGELDWTSESPTLSSEANESHSEKDPHQSGDFSVPSFLPLVALRLDLNTHSALAICIAQFLMSLRPRAHLSMGRSHIQQFATPPPVRFI